MDKFLSPLPIDCSFEDWVDSRIEQGYYHKRDRDIVIANMYKTYNEALEICKEFTSK